ncbi:MAG: biosynthetic-type acetolactate synthase large subunit [Deltaproteobacteria bacterium]|nr:biosynthetic-type acetolactate synthase large subunit [Deltaproteobacteria bacterium]
MKISGADLIVKLIERQNITTIAGIPGGANLPLYDALSKSSIKHILARHEQGGGFIAQGMARSTGKPSVCFATSGPGVTNLVTAIADANMDSVPVIAITGQTPLPLIGTDAFQEVDTYGLFLPITKHNFLVRSAKELLTVIPEAFKVAVSGRPGPVLIDIPKDVQLEIIEIDELPEIGQKTISPIADINKILEAAEMINSSKKPVLYIGGGIVNSNCCGMIKDLSEKSSIPVTSTLMGLGAYNSKSELYLGMLGMHGAKHTNIVVDQSDLLIAVGVRFDDRATGKIEDFCNHANIIHIDIDYSEIDKIRESNCGIKGDACEVLKILLPLIDESKRTNWIKTITNVKDENPVMDYDDLDIFYPGKLIYETGIAAGKNVIVTTDVGQHQMWTAQSYPFSRPGQFLTSGGLGTMGFGLPTAIGAALANPDKKIICFSGDGSILMNIQELATLSEQNLNVKIIILNNGHLGLVRQQQELFYNENYMASKFECRPDFSKIAEGFGINSFKLNNCVSPIEALQEIMKAEGPTLIEVDIDPNENVYPMVPPGAANIEMITEGA